MCLHSPHDAFLGDFGEQVDKVYLSEITLFLFFFLIMGRTRNIIDEPCTLNPDYENFQFFSIITIFSAEILKHPGKEVHTDVEINFSESTSGKKRFFQSADISGKNNESEFTPDSGSDSGAYTISSDGAVTLTFAGEDSEVMTGVLCADGQTIIFGYGDYDDSEKYASFGIGVGVKKAVTQTFMSSAIFLLLNE